MLGSAKMTTAGELAAACPNQHFFPTGRNKFDKLLFGAIAALVLFGGHAPVANAQLSQVFPVTQVWKYDTACHDGDNWQTPAYNDSGWSSGPGGFTGGETNPQITPILNTTGLPAPSSLTPAGHAIYFRTHFSMATVANISLVMSNAIDDGAIIYLNGTQILNLRVTTSSSCASFSGGAIGAGTDALLWEVHTFPPPNLAGILQVGTNVLAVEVHQVNATSSDMVFGMVLMSQPTPPPILYTNGTGVITFDTPPPASQWSTMTWGGASSAPASPADLDTAAQTNDASLINQALNASAGAPPAAGAAAVYASDTGQQYLETRPTAVAYEGIMATLTNASGATVNGIGLKYDLTVVAPMAEEVNGHLVYWSRTGAPGSWVQIPDLSNQPTDNTAGTYSKHTTIDLNSNPWTAGGLLYFLWVDDNGSGTPDAALEIDNVQFLSLNPVPPSFANAADPTNRTLSECSSTTFTAGTAIGAPPPTYQWYKNDAAHPIADAVGMSYTITNAVAADVGTYFVRASNSSGPSAESHHATLTMTPPPAFVVLSAVSSTNGGEVVVSFNLPVDPASLDMTPLFQFGFTPDLNITNSFVTNSTNIVLQTDPRSEGQNYDLSIIEDVVDVCPGSTLTGGPFHVISDVYLLTVDASWQYNDSGVDPGAGWIATGYNDAAWSTGSGILDGKNTGPRTTLNGQTINTTLSLSNLATIYNSPANVIPTYEFRTHFTFPGNPSAPGAGLILLPFIDDAAIFYINGHQVGAVGFTNPPTGPTDFHKYGSAYTSRTVDDANFDPGINLPLTNVVNGDNVLAVELKQERGSSSDITMGLELIGVIPTFVPKLTEMFDGSTLILTWPFGTLQSNPHLNNPNGWTDVDGASSPFPVNNVPSKNPKGLFYRLR